MLDDKLTSTLDALRQKYVSSLEMRQRQLAEQVLYLCDNGFPQDGRSDLFYLVHNIVGVAPTYGLPRLGRMAAQAEALLTDATDQQELSETQEDDVIVIMEQLIMEMGRTHQTQHQTQH